MPSLSRLIWFLLSPAAWFAAGWLWHVGGGWWVQASSGFLCCSGLVFMCMHTADAYVEGADDAEGRRAK